MEGDVRGDQRGGGREGSHPRREVADVSAGSPWIALTFVAIWTAVIPAEWAGVV